MQLIQSAALAVLFICLAFAQNEIGLPSGPIPGPGVEFVALPDPVFPETMKQENIDKLRAWGVIQVPAFADASQVLRVTGVIPAEPGPGKYWSDTRAKIWQDLKRYRYLKIDGKMTAGPINFSDKSFDYYSPTAAALYRAGYSTDLIPAIPVLRELEYTHEDAGRINLNVASAIPFPIAGFKDVTVGEVGAGSTFPSDVALRCRPGVAVGCLVEAFKIEAFVRSYPAPSSAKPATSKLSTAEFLSFVAEILSSGQDPDIKRTLITRAAKQ